MKKNIVFALAFLFGLILFLLNGPIGSRVDNIIFDQEIRLSKAFNDLEKGDQEAHDKGLAEFILSGRGSKPVRALALYNLGNSALTRAGKGDQAAAKDVLFYFKEALRNDPLLFPAKFNLEILVRANKEKEKGEGRDTSKQREGEQEESKEQKPDEGLDFPPPLLGSTP
ncbi:MAG: hypothetical protein C4576_20920 [Desulfobacteraceae bacterium]|nr:MAG: hypothetical protein C4576_20920 [Desulfobacteraceae bacterium]